MYQDVLSHPGSQSSRGFSGEASHWVWLGPRRPPFILFKNDFSSFRVSVQRGEECGYIAKFISYFAFIIVLVLVTFSFV